MPRLLFIPFLQRIGVLRLSRDAAVLLVTGIIVPSGGSLGTENISRGYWVDSMDREVPSTAASRGITFGASVAGLITTVRILLGLERPYMGTGQ